MNYYLCNDKEKDGRFVLHTSQSKSEVLANVERQIYRGDVDVLCVMEELEIYIVHVSGSYIPMDT